MRGSLVRARGRGAFSLGLLATSMLTSAAHAALIQILLAGRPLLRGPPANEFLQQHVEPLINAAQVAASRRLVTLGRSARTDAKVRVRQPLSRALLLHPGIELDEATEAEIRTELNVKVLERIEGRSTALRPKNIYRVVKMMPELWFEVRRSRPLRADWETVKESIMREALHAKFTQHEDLRELLLGTDDRPLVEHTRNDRYWADGGDGSGLNRLGILLMELRASLASL